MMTSSSSTIHLNMSTFDSQTDGKIWKKRSHHVHCADEKNIQTRADLFSE
jgi:hypothetical protein